MKKKNIIIPMTLYVTVIVVTVCKLLHEQDYLRVILWKFAIGMLNFLWPFELFWCLVYLRDYFSGSDCTDAVTPVVCEQPEFDTVSEALQVQTCCQSLTSHEILLLNPDGTHSLLCIPSGLAAVCSRDLSMPLCCDQSSFLGNSSQAPLSCSEEESEV